MIILKVTSYDIYNDIYEKANKNTFNDNPMVFRVDTSIIILHYSIKQTLKIRNSLSIPKNGGWNLPLKRERTNDRFLWYIDRAMNGVRNCQRYLEVICIFPT